MFVGRAGIILVLWVVAVWFVTCTRANEGREPVSNFSPKAKLGQYLFFDTRLSFNNTKSCSSCHDPQFAFTDGYRRSTTSTGESVLRNTPTLINCASLKFFDWANPAIQNLARQHLRPLYNKHPIEMGVSGFEDEIVSRFEKDTLYPQLFQAAFRDGKAPVNFKNIISSLAEYVGSLNSLNSPYDAAEKREGIPLSISAERGKNLFFSSKLNCSSCHAPPYFTLATRTKDIDDVYVNIGLYNVNNANRYPIGDEGLMSGSKREADTGRFRIPTLRNVALTAPYFHDGSVASLGEVIDIYASAGRNLQTGPNAGNGQVNKFKDRRIVGFSITREEKSDLIDFLYSLSDSTIFSNPNFRNPFKSYRTNFQ